MDTLRFVYYIGMVLLLSAMPFRATCENDLNWFTGFGEVDEPLFTIPNVGLVTVLGTKPIVVDDNTELNVQVFASPDDMVAYGNKIFLKKGNVIYQCFHDQIERKFSFDTESFRMMPLDEPYLAIIHKENDVTYLFAYDTEKGSSTPLYSIKDEVIYCCGSLNKMIIVTSQDVFSVTTDQTECFLSYYESFSAAVQTSYGLVLASQSDVFFLTAPEQVGLILGVGCDALYSSGRMLYLKKDKQVYRINLEQWLGI